MRNNPTVPDIRLTRKYEIARDLVDAAALDNIRRNALAARFTNPDGSHDRSVDERP
jgi:hypothetical protein